MYRARLGMCFAETHAAMCKSKVIQFTYRDVLRIYRVFSRINRALVRIYRARLGPYFREILFAEMHAAVQGQVSLCVILFFW